MEGLCFESITTVSREAFAEWVEERARQGDSHEFELLNGRITVPSSSMLVTEYACWFQTRDAEPAVGYPRGGWTTPSSSPTLKS